MDHPEGRQREVERGGNARERAADEREKVEALRGKAPGVANWSRSAGTELGPVTATPMSCGDIAVRLAPRLKGKEAEEVVADARGRIEEELPGVRVEFVQVLQDTRGAAFARILRLPGPTASRRAGS